MIEFTPNETEQLNEMFGIDAEYYEDREDTFVVQYLSMDDPAEYAANHGQTADFELNRPPAVEAFMLRRGDTGRLEVHDGDGFDWKVYDAARDEAEFQLASRQFDGGEFSA